MEGTVTSKAAAAFVGEAEPFCFHVANVRFVFEEERRDPLE